jgi:hypothetical protein
MLPRQTRPMNVKVRITMPKYSCPRHANWHCNTASLDGAQLLRELRVLCGDAAVMSMAVPMRTAQLAQASQLAR